MFLIQFYFRDTIGKTSKTPTMKGIIVPFYWFLRALVLMKEGTMAPF